jgi:quercetin dioxygenase-like cupin family protein
MNRFVRAIVRYVVPCTWLAACRGARPPPDVAATTAAASSSSRSAISRRLIAQQELPDLPGWETRLYLIEYPPGAAAPPHVHPAIGLGYVLAGRFESAFEREEPIVVEQGKSFIDRAGAVHTLFRNPDPERPLRFLIAYTIRRGEEPLRAAASDP